MNSLLGAYSNPGRQWRENDAIQDMGPHHYNGFYIAATVSFLVCSYLSRVLMLCPPKQCVLLYRWLHTPQRRLWAWIETKLEIMRPKNPSEAREGRSIAQRILYRPTMTIFALILG